MLIHFREQQESFLFLTHTLICVLGRVSDQQTLVGQGCQQQQGAPEALCLLLDGVLQYFLCMLAIRICFIPWFRHAQSNVQQYSFLFYVKVM